MNGYWQSSRRKIPLSTSCVQEIIMTDVTFTAVQLQAACLGTRGRSASRETGHIPTHLYIYSSVLLDQLKNFCLELFCQFILGLFSYFETQKSVGGEQGNCLVFVTIQVAWKHICYCQTVFKWILMCVSLVLLLRFGDKWKNKIIF